MLPEPEPLVAPRPARSRRWARWMGFTLLGLVLLALCGGAFRSVQALLARNQELTREAAESEAQVARLQSLQESMARRLKLLDAQGSSLVQERALLSEQLREKEAQQTQLQATQSDLEAKLREEIQRGDIRLSHLDERLRVDLVEKVLFDSGQAELSERGRSVLARVGTVLSKVEGRLIQVAGHTDDSPPTPKLAELFPSNWELSAARAVNVVRFLHESAHVPAQRLVAAGYGQFQPVALNVTPEGRARNRRIELLLMPALKPTPAMASVDRPQLPPKAKKGARRAPNSPRPAVAREHE